MSTSSKVRQVRCCASECPFAAMLPSGLCDGCRLAPGRDIWSLMANRQVPLYGAVPAKCPLRKLGSHDGVSLHSDARFR